MTKFARILPWVVLLAGAASRFASAAPPAALPKSIPAAENRPALTLPENVDLAALKLPDAIKPGLRITYHAGNSIVPGVKTKLVPGRGPGKWIDPKTGKTFDDDDTRASGGVGFHQANIVFAGPQFVAVDARNYQITDVQKNITSYKGAAAASGNAACVGVYWIHPSLLELISAEGGPPQPAGVKINRDLYPLGTTKYNAVQITTDFSNGVWRAVYDAETGLLLYSGSINAGAPVPVVAPQGKVSPGQGDTMMSHMSFVASRQLDIPWAGDPTPKWVVKGVRLNYRGQTALKTGIMPLPPLALSSSIEVGDVVEGVARCRCSVAQDIGAGLPPQQTSEIRYFASAMLAPLWISPVTIGKLKANQVLDEDRVIGFRTFFAGVNQNLAVVVEQGPTETLEHAYDTVTGGYVGVRSTKQTQAGQVRSEAMLTK
ncbi:MAG: hypothetical protein PHU85_04975 [Phycisphaerae bacterium]|nr:hypothetical protein [Phycisphaerae bacterium]